MHGFMNVRLCAVRNCPVNPDSVVDVVIDPRAGPPRNPCSISVISETSSAVLRYTQPSSKWAPKVTTYIRMSGTTDLPPLPPYSVAACTGKNLLLILSFSGCNKSQTNIHGSDIILSNYLSDKKRRRR